MKLKKEIIILFLFVYYFYMKATKFEKIITIKKEFTQPSESLRQKSLFANLIGDTNDNIYSITNNILLSHFTAAEKLLQIEPGKTYKISGYGTRIPFLFLYPNILEIKPIN
jgi:hypothetical protein